MTTFPELLGIYDNLHEPRPALNNGSVMIAVVISFLAVTLLCAFLRLWCRVIVVKAAGWDDFFIILVVISISIGSIGTCVATNHGLGEHILQFTALGLDLEVFLRIFYICNGTLPMSTSFIKLAILLQYLRTFDKGSKSRLITIIMIFLTSAWGLAFMFLAWVPCLPIRAYWDWSQPALGRWGFGTQIAEELIRTYESHAASNMLLDFIIFAIPLPLYFNKDANNRSRKGVLVLFLLGSVVLMLSAWRLVSLVRSRAGTYPTFDPTWYASVPMVLTILEIDVAAICASLPVFWPVIMVGMGKIFVTHEVKVEVTTEHEFANANAAARGGAGDDCDDLELAQCAGTRSSFSHSQPSPTQDTDTLVFDPERQQSSRIFGAYMMGKTTTQVTKIG